MIYLIAFCLFAILSMVGIFSIYEYYEKKYIVNLKELPKYAEVIIVLGAGIRPDGTPCDILKDRLFAAAEVYNEGICRKVLLTGEHRDEDYSEIFSMKNWIMQYNVAEKDIILDGYGYCTYDSIYRAKDKLKINKAIISTNRYHLPRALYIASRMGMQAYGIASDLRQYDRMKKYKRRERLAQLKDFFLVSLLKIRNSSFSIHH